MQVPRRRTILSHRGLIGATGGLMRSVWLAGGGVVATIAVAAAVTIGTRPDRHGASAAAPIALTTSAKTSAAPATTPLQAQTQTQTPAPAPVDISKLFDYAIVASVYGNDSLKQPPRTELPVSAARDTMTILRAVDPSSAHARAVKAASADVKIVPDGSEPELHQVSLGSAWTTDGKQPYTNTYTLGGYLEIDFGDSHAMLGSPGYPPQGAGPCGIEPADLGMVHSGDPNSPWTACTVRKLDDGSTVSTSSSRRGPGTITFAVREFPGGHGGIAITAIDFPLVHSLAGAPLDAAHVLSPSPWTELSLATVLSSPGLQPAL